MKLSATEDGALNLEEIPLFLFQLLQEIPSLAASDDPRVEERFFPSPSPDAQLAEDWKSFVQPELCDLFLSCRDTALADLRGAVGTDGIFAMRIPPKHMDAWLNVLNQARLAIAEEHNFQEKDLAEEIAPDPSDPRSLALFQISLYGFLQECLVRMQEE